MSITRQAAGTLLSELDFHLRAAGKTPPKAGPKPAAKEKVPAEPDPEETGGEAAVPLPGPEDADMGEIPEDPEELMELVLTQVREDLDWDGRSGDPNESVAALEDALADMFDANVDIVWDGETTMTLRVEGEDPVPLTADYLGELLEALAKQGDGGGGEADAPEPEDGETAEAGERGHLGQVRFFGGRKGNFKESNVSRDPGGEDGGQFIKKGTTAAGAAAGAVKAGASKAGASKASGGGNGASGGKGGGPKAPNLAARAKGRSSRRTVAKAIGNALSAGTGSRVKVAGNKDGTYNVGVFKKRMGSRKMAIAMLGVWTASAGVSLALAMVGGIPAAAGVPYPAYRAAKIMRELRDGGA